MNCVRLLCKHGAHTNCSSRSNLTPLHVLVFTASENIALNREEEKAQVMAKLISFQTFSTVKCESSMRSKNLFNERVFDTLYYANEVDLSMNLFS